MKEVFQIELARKGIHAFNAVIPLIHLYIIKNKFMMLCILSCFIVFCFFIEIFRMKESKTFNFINYFLGFMMRNNEKKGELTGATWVFVGFLFTIILIPYPYSILSMLFLSFGDTFAAIVGTSLPLIKIGNKTFSGFIGCFVACLSIGFILNLDISHEIILIGSLMAAIVEIIPIPINDNFTIPVFSGLVMYLTSMII